MALSPRRESLGPLVTPFHAPRALASQGVGPESPFAKVAQNLKRLQAGFSELAWSAAE